MNSLTTRDTKGTGKVLCDLCPKDSLGAFFRLGSIIDHKGDTTKPLIQNDLPRLYELCGLNYRLKKGAVFPIRIPNAQLSGEGVNIT
jgi:hypothetical protein